MTYTNQIKYWLLLVVIVSMFFSIKVYINRLSISDEINHVNSDTEKSREKTVFTNEFLFPYLSSDYNTYFVLHENNILSRWEFMIEFKIKDSKKMSGIVTWKKLPDWYISPQKSWQKFLAEKLEYLN